MVSEPNESAKAARRPILAGRIIGGAILFVFAIVAYRQIADGRIFIDKWAADTAFVLDIILRIASGQIPHVDFTLHLGSLPYLLAAATNGETPAQSFLIAQAIFSGLCLLIGLWIWRTRLTSISGPLLLLFVLILGMTLAIPTLSEVSLALFYNRWGWVLALLFACQTLLPSRLPGWSRVDGALAGVIAFCLLMTKVTFFAGLLPAALLCTAARGQWREIGWGIAAFLGLVGLSMVAEPMLFPNYLENISWAATNPLRPNAGTGWVALLSGNAFLGYTIAFAIFLACVARTRGITEAIWLTVAAVGFYFIQYQNFLTAPFWVLFLLLYAIVQASAASTPANIRRVWIALSIAFAFFATTLLLPMTIGLRDGGSRVAMDGYIPFPPEGRLVTGAYFPGDTIRPIETRESPEFPTAAPWTGATECDFVTGWTGAAIEIAETVAGLPGPVFIADSISPHWALAGVDPVPGVALWNYGSARGIENADFVVVPRCGIKPNFKREILRELERQNVSLGLETETVWATVYRVLDK